MVESLPEVAISNLLSVRLRILSALWFQRSGWVGLLAGLIVATGAVVRGAEPRLALASSELTEKTAAAVALAEVELTRRADVVVLERKAVDAVVQEQRLAAGGFATTEDAVRIGQLLTADVFVHIEGVWEQEAAAAVVVFDAVTGVRLEDSVAVGSDVPSLSKALVARVDVALQKRRLPVGKVVAISVLSSRDVGQSDSTAQSLGVLLERRLLGAPAIVVVERKRLEHVNQERALPANTPTAALLSAPVLIELDVTRGPDGKAIRVAAFLTDPAGVDHGTIRIEGSDVAAVVSALVPPILQAVHTAGNLDEQHPDLEALRFFKVCRFWKAHGRPDRSLEAAEAADALNPGSPLLEAALVNALFSSVGQLAGSTHFSSTIGTAGVHVVLQPGEVPSADRLQALRNAARGMALLLQPTRPGAVVPAVLQRERTLLEADDKVFFRGFGKRVAAARAQLAFSKAEEAAYAEFCRDWRVQSPFSQKQAVPAWDLLLFISESYQYYYPDLATAWTVFSENLHQWVDQHMDQDMPHLRQPLLSTVVRAGDRSSQSNPVDYSIRDRIWSWMEAHDRPMIRLYGRCGRVVDAARQEKGDEAQLAREFFQEICRTLRDPKLDNDLRETCYQTALLAARRHGWYLARTPEQSLRDLQPVFQAMLDVGDAHEDVLKSLKFLLDAAPKTKTNETLVAVASAAEARLAQPAGLAEPARTQLRMFFDWVQDQRGLAKPAAPPIKPFARIWQLTPQMAEGRFAGFQQPLTAQGVIDALTVFTGPNRLVLQQWNTNSLLASKLGSAALTTTPNVVDACLTERQYIALVKGQGVFVFDRNSAAVEVWNSQPGLPIAEAAGIAALDQQLYLGTENGYLMRCSLTNRSDTALLACSSRREVLSPFDNGDPVRIPFVCADAPRGRILFLASVQTGEGWAGLSMTDLCGLWEYRPDTGKFRQRLPFKFRFRDLRWGKRVGPDQLIFELQDYNHFVFRYDMRTDAGEFFSMTPATLGLGAFELNKRVPFAKNAEGVSTRENPLTGAPPFLIHGDWLWTGQPWGRSSLKTFQFQELPPLSGAGQAHAFSPQLAIQAVGPHQLLLATVNELWLVDLKASQ